MVNEPTTFETQQSNDLAAPPIGISWTAILGGAVASLGVGALLYSLGLALGLSSIEPRDPSSLRGAGLFTGIWTIVASFLALFVGGLVASRGAGALTRIGAAIDGLVMWALTTVAGAVLVLNVLGHAVSGAASVGSSVMETGVGAMNNAPDTMMKTLGVSPDDLLGPVNQRLEAQGKPAITADQLQTATRDVTRRALREGRLDRESLVSALARDTNLSRADAEDLANRFENQFATVRAHIDEVARNAPTTALRAAETTGKAFWGVFGALFVGLVSSILGAMLGVSRRQRLWAEHPPLTHTRALVGSTL